MFFRFFSFHCTGQMIQYTPVKLYQGGVGMKSPLAMDVRGEFGGNCLTLLPGRQRTLLLSGDLDLARMSVVSLRELSSLGGNQ